MARILVVDDAAFMRARAAKVLEEAGHEVHQAENGVEAVKQYAENRPDAVLMDLKMPSMDGISATREISENHPDVKVVILTTFDADNHVIQALKAGASGYILKNSRVDAIVSSLVAVVAGEKVMAGAVANRVLEMLTGSTTPKEFYDGLTSRELEILKRQVPDGEIRAKLTPDYRIGCKRIIISSDFLGTFMNSNVELVTQGSGFQKPYGTQGIGSGRMPGFGQELTARQIDEIVLYERSL